jgi:hypothetical protein
MSSLSSERFGNTFLFAQFTVCWGEILPLGDQKIRRGLQCKLTVNVIQKKFTCLSGP